MESPAVLMSFWCHRFISYASRCETWVRIGRLGKVSLFSGRLRLFLKLWLVHPIASYSPQWSFFVSRHRFISSLRHSLQFSLLYSASVGFPCLERPRSAPCFRLFLMYFSHYRQGFRGLRNTCAVRVAIVQSILLPRF